MGWGRLEGKKEDVSDFFQWDTFSENQNGWTSSPFEDIWGYAKTILHRNILGVFFGGPKLGMKHFFQISFAE